jgi:ferritin-like metal-binding protein YciE
VKDAIMRLGGEGFVLFAHAQRDTPGKLAAHVLSYEALEWAAYELVEQFARADGDEEVAGVARHIRSQEEGMMRRVEALLDQTVAASLLNRSDRAMEDLLCVYLRDAHALETQSIQLLEDGARIVGRGECRSVLIEHLSSERMHKHLLEQRLASLGRGPSRIKDAALRIGARTWTAFIRALRETAARYAASLFAFQYLEIAGYEQLQRVAARVGDTTTEETVCRILREERRAADQLSRSLESSVDLAAAG